MAISVADIRKYHFAETEGLLLDTNVWLLLYGPGEPHDSRVDVYSEAFVQILNAKSRINLDALVLAEFINRFARFEFELFKSNNEAVPDSFKRFRNTPDFVPIALAISVAAKKLVKHSYRVESIFADLPVEKVLDDFGKGGQDFNDQLLGELCMAKGYVLVTDDGDFTAPGLRVVTANAKLLGH
jgi:predicted nucleic acid-binding protein